MENPVRMFQIKQELTEQNMSILSMIRPDDICFFRFIGGNVAETEKLIQQLSRLKETKALLFGMIRFPFRFEGKKRFQTAIMQYHRMKEICDGMTYFMSDGMMEILEPGTSIREANLLFDQLEEAPVDAVREMIQLPGAMNIDVRDLQTFITAKSGPCFIRTITGDSFDEPLKYLISTPYLPEDYADGEQMIINIGYSQNVDMTAFRQINLRLNDLFHKADLFKLGTYLIDQPGSQFKITLIVNGIQDPFPRPGKLKRLPNKRQWVKHRIQQLTGKGLSSKLLSPIVKREG